MIKLWNIPHLMNLIKYLKSEKRLNQAPVFIKHSLTFTIDYANTDTNANTNTACKERDIFLLLRADRRWKSGLDVE